MTGETTQHCSVTPPEGHDLPALDGELIPPTRAVKRHYSNAEEIEFGSRIRAEHEAGERAAKEAVRHWRRAGEMLLKAKAELIHGHFQLFLKDAVEIHPRSAQRYMLLAREMAKLPAQEATRVSQLSLRDALGELSRATAKATKLKPQSLADALKQAKRDPLKKALVVATNAEKHPPAKAKPVDTPRAPVLPPRPPQMAPHVASLARALRRAVKVYLQEYQEMTRAEVLEALNEVYIAVQDGEEGGR